MFFLSSLIISMKTDLAGNGTHNTDSKGPCKMDSLRWRAGKGKPAWNSYVGAFQQQDILKKTFTKPAEIYKRFPSAHKAELKLSRFREFCVQVTLTILLGLSCQRSQDQISALLAWNPAREVVILQKSTGRWLPTSQDLHACRNKVITTKRK